MDHMIRVVGASAEVRAFLAAALEPAVLVDGELRILLLNAAAEKLLGCKAGETIGRKCHEVLAGRDVFGNPFCHAQCAVLEAVRRHEPVRPFDMSVVCASGKQLLRVSTLHAADPALTAGGVIHVLHALERPEPAAARAPSPDAPDSVARVELFASLTERERRVLGGIADGLQNKEIASALSISPSTVRNHIHRILEKLEVETRLEALVLALRNGWIAHLPAARKSAEGRRRGEP